MRINRVMIYVLAAAAVVLPFAGGCISKSPIDQAVICKEVSKSGEPLLVADNLTPDIGMIYCSVKIASPAAKSKLKAEWYVVKSEEAGMNDYLMNASTIVADLPYVVFAFVRPDELLPRGDYQVKLYVDDKFVLSVPFQIQGEPVASSATLSEAVLCSSIDRLTGKPIGGAASIFPSDASSIYCSVKVSGARFNDQLKAQWTYLGGELTDFQGQTLARQSTKIEGREYVTFSVGPKEGKSFPLGDYSLALYVDSRELAKLPFTVVVPAEVKGPYFSEAATWAYKDKEKTTVILAAQFPVDATDIILRAKFYNAPQDTKMSLQWIIVRSDDAGLDNYLIREDKYVISDSDVLVVMLTRGKDTFVKGDYVVKLLINGVEKAAVPFRVR